ncbi:MAG: MBL fold metallo-hydrolase [Candidatus Melainabacteria bacterium]|nr:MBL fold metallo-hydrolase [Candidatus Melainabacteria bacterium]
MLVKTIKVGPMECNCSIAVCPETGDAILVDPGGNAEEITAMIESTGARVKAIVITHAHFDHVIAAGKIREITGAPVCLHRKDMLLYRLMPLQYRMAQIAERRPPRPDRLLREGDRVDAGSLSFSVLHTPGHSPGSCCFHQDEGKLLFSGDTLFCRSVGNWKVPFGNFEKLFPSILDKIMVLPDETRVIPGHGPETTVGDERLSNPYLQPGRVAELREEERKRPGTARLLLAMIVGMFTNTSKRKKGP